MNTKIEELANNKALTDRLANAKSPEEIMELLKAEGLEVTPAHAKEAYNYLNANTSGDELSEEALENVSGGVWGIVIGWTVLNIAVYGTAFAFSKNY